MKKTILVVLMVAMIAAPCLAQEVERDGVSSVEGTLWRSMYEMHFATLPPFLDMNITEYIGFHQDIVYFCDEYSECRPSNTLTIIESPLGAIGMIVSLSKSSVFMETRIFLRNGFGVIIGFGGMMHGIPVLIAHIGIMFKVDDDWLPQELSSVSPNQGERGTILTDVTITGVNTTFKDDGVDSVFFRPFNENSITVSDINVISNTEIEFDLAIAADAVRGFRNVVVRSGGRPIVGENAFEVLPKSN